MSICTGAFVLAAAGRAGAEPHERVATVSPPATTLIALALALALVVTGTTPIAVDVAVQDAGGVRVPEGVQHPDAVCSLVVAADAAGPADGTSRWGRTRTGVRCCRTTGGAAVAPRAAVRGLSFPPRHGRCGCSGAQLTKRTAVPVAMPVTAPVTVRVVVRVTVHVTVRVTVHVGVCMVVRVAVRAVVRVAVRAVVRVAVVAFAASNGVLGLRGGRLGAGRAQARRAAQTVRSVRTARSSRRRMLCGLSVSRSSSSAARSSGLSAGAAAPRTRCRLPWA